ncbi:hypothetical protein [Sphingomonas abietis]|uniref:Tetratricopeptide repeat protein n=1 Tax=Sphingomonas abietis TaxID=3012344 RepID=A0ABY7NGZ5_9SPHN|nr:hypothetical protein [Sphingomonas abietis]WBO20814.1 hypothetical protein PBT88_11385 [Sphingomonas abietis]
MADDARFVPGPVVRWSMLGAALLLGWISVRAGVQGNFQESDPAVAVQAWPAGGTALEALARGRVAAASGEIDDTTRSLYRSALTQEPLLANPLALAALDAANSGHTDRAERLMLAARDRDIRIPMVRFWLFDHFVRTGQYPRALDEVGPAIRLQSDSITAIMTVLAAIASTPDGNSALAHKLASHPFWETDFFNTAKNSTPPEALLTLLSRLPNPAQALDEQRAVFLALIDAGDGARAYQTWRQLVPAVYRTQIQGVYDGNFSHWPGAEPFNWMLTNDSNGTARMVSASDLPQSTALDVRYFGTDATMLAEQYTDAAPGLYKLELAARRRSTAATGGRLAMEVRCMRGDLLATLPLDPLDLELRAFSMPVTVPAGCGLLRVRLVGAPGDLFSEVEAQITGVTLVRGG